jgi:hypothetical protein
MRSILPKPQLTSHPVDVGHRAEAAILAELVKRGYSVLLPFGVNQRYDLDLFIVYCPQNDRVFVIPVDEVPATGMYLRVDATRNRQSKRVRWAKDYELPA